MKLSVTYRHPKVEVEISAPALCVSTGTTVARDYVERPAYEGETTVIPTNETQTLHTKNLRMTDDIVVNPIPSNYGLITWNGSVITVS